MPKLKNRVPKLSRVGNYAYVYWAGKRYPMGRWESEECQSNYRRFLANLTAYDPKSDVCTVGILIDAYLHWAAQNIESRDIGHIKTVAQFVLSSYDDLPLKEFGPRALTVVQHQLELSGRFSRKYINKLINRTRSIFRWGVAQELVPPSVADALKYVPALRKGRTSARETVPRQEVSDEVVDRTLPYLLPTVAAMVQVQRYACMRPNEVCRMKVGEIDTSGEIWIYCPIEHKGTWRGQGKAVALGRPEQELIAPYLIDKTPDQHVFSPQTAMQERKVRDAAKRKTKVQPSQTERAARRAANPKSRVRGYYESESYAKSVKHALERANKSGEKIPHWTPYQLRHAAVTEITFENNGDLNIARAVAGQKSISVTQIYNHADLQIAVEQAKKREKKKPAAPERATGSSHPTPKTN